jgi:excisionase family DNA binding protein
MTAPAREFYREPLWSEAEVAQALAVSPDTVRGWRLSGSIDFYQLGRRIAYSRDQIEAFLAERERKGRR